MNVYRAAGKAAALHKCNESQQGCTSWLFHWPIASVQRRSPCSFSAGIHTVCSILLISCKALRFRLVQEHIHTISFLILYTGHWPIGCQQRWACPALCRHTYMMQHINYIFAMCDPLAGLRAYAHYISPHIVHPSLTHCISTKVSSSSTLQADIQYAAYSLYLCKALALRLAREHMHTIYSKSSHSTYSIDPLHLCNSEPILHTVTDIKHAAY